MEKNRLEAFSDGVLAIVITIMVLGLKQPAGDRMRDFAALWPTLLAYLVSFLFVAIYWVNHHLLFQEAQKINVGILWCNIAWLFSISFIPFGTEWVGSYPSAFAPLCLYFANMLLTCILFHLMHFLILKENGEKLILTVRSIISFAVYTLAALAGGFCPIAAFIAVVIVNCWWIITAKKKKVQSE